MPANEKNRAAEVEYENLPADEAGREFDLMELLFRLLEKSVWIAAAAVAVAVLVGAYTLFFAAPVYQSTAKLYVVSASDTAINLSDLNLGDKVAGDFVQVFKNQDVYDQVAIKMKNAYEGYDLTVEHPYKKIGEIMSISVLSNTRILQITVKTNDPVETQRIATAYAEVAKQFIAGRMLLDPPTDFEVARLGVKCGPSLVRNVVIGFLLGAVAAIGVFIVLFTVDDRIRTADQLQKHLGLATLGMMPVMASGNRDRKRLAKGAK